jgi:hypothetical protein
MAVSFPFPPAQSPAVRTNQPPAVAAPPTLPIQGAPPLAISPTQAQNLNLGIAGYPPVALGNAPQAPVPVVSPPVASVTATPQVAQARQPQVGFQQPNVPEIFKAIRPIEAAATRMTGWDPRNPPTMHTISKSQFLSMNRAQRDNYKNMATRRAQMILQAKTKWEELVNMGLDEAMSGPNKTAILQDQSKVIERKNVAEQLLKRVEDAAMNWQISVNDGLSNGYLRYDPTTKLYQANDPKYTALARQVNAQRPQIERDISEAQRAHADALKNYDTMQGLAVKSGLSIVPGESAKPNQNQTLIYDATTGELKPKP